MHSVQNGTSKTWHKITAKAIANALSDAISLRGKASLIVPGGSTAKMTFSLLANADLDWKRITITLADERWTSPDSPDSNEHMVRENLMCCGAEKAVFVGLKTKAGNPHEAVAEASDRIGQISRPFDVAFLGMGEDGHIASLFPGCPHGAGKNVIAVERPDYPRISLTSATLLNSRKIILAVYGAAKLKTLENAKKDGPPDEFPVRHVLHQARVPLTIITG